MCCFCSFTIKFRLSVPFWYILHAYVSLLPVKFFSLSSLWMDLVSIGTFCWFQCVNYVCLCVLSAKTLLSFLHCVFCLAWFISTVFLCVCFPRFFCDLHASKREGIWFCYHLRVTSLLLHLLASQHFQYSVHVEGKRDPHFFCFF